MKMKLQFVRIVCLIALMDAALCRAEGPYRLLGDIPIGGRADESYLSIDSKSHRLYVAHGTKIEVINTATNHQCVAEITNSSAVRGMVLVPKIGHGFMTLGQESAVRSFDLFASKTGMKFKTGKNPGPIILQPARMELYVFNQDDQTACVYEADDGDFEATIKLPGKPVCAAAGSKSGQVYCGIADRNEILVIDSRTRKVINQWPVAPGKGVSAIAVDEARHRLLVGCVNKLMVVMDSATGQVLSTVPAGGAVDAIAFDPETRLVFGASSEGNITVVQEEYPENLTVVQTLKTNPGARTMVLDPATHNIYLATASIESLPKKVSDAPSPRPRMVSDGLKVLVYGMDGVTNPSR